jgi:hypothetical protein
MADTMFTAEYSMTFYKYLGLVMSLIDMIVRTLTDEPTVANRISLTFRAELGLHADGKHSI